MRRALRDEIQALLDAQRDDVASDPKPALSDEERREVAARWPQVVCPFCGAWHPGLCNRVRRVEMDDQGRPRITVFWEKWEPNERSIWPEDVWASRAEMANQLEAQALEAAQRAEIARTAARESERRRRESQAPESPRELAARLVRGVRSDGQ